MVRLKNKHGEGYIFPCVMIILLCMIMSVLIFFAGAVNMVRITRENAKIVMDSYVMKNSIAIYDSIKQGNDYTESIDATEYIDDLCEFCTFVKRGNYLYAYDSNGKVKYQMTKPYFTFKEENTLKIQVHYTLYVPVWFNGRAVRSISIPVTADSSFKEKF